MKGKKKYFLSEDKVGKFLSLHREGAKDESFGENMFTSNELEKLKVLNEEFEKQKRNLIDFVKEIRNFTRKDQANAVKLSYGTKNIKSKIAFRMIDSLCGDKLTEKEEVDLFIFCSKFLTQ
jgi:hypothetical protein